MIDRRNFLTGLAAVIATPWLAGTAWAHHGWSWTDAGEFQLVGLIREVRLGNPHGVLIVQAEDGMWTAEIGQPGRNARAGLTEEQLQPGTEVTLIGHRSADVAELRMKAERVIIAGVLYNLYPNRS